MMSNAGMAAASLLSTPPRVWRGMQLCLRPVFMFLLATATAATFARSPTTAAQPRLSDVVFSPRFLSPEAPEAVQAWGATRIEWVYLIAPTAKAVLSQLPRGVGQTLNANPKLPRGEGYALDFDGKPIVAPWMKSWGAKWVTTTHPETRQVLFEQVDQFIALGARSIQIDDPHLQVYAATRQPGDFNPATQRGFRDWLRNRADPAAVKVTGLSDFDGDYRAFLIRRHQVRDAEDYRRRFRQFPSTALWLAYIRDTVVEHYVTLRQRLQAVRPQPVALSMNITDLIWPDMSQEGYFLAPFADYVLSETRITDTNELVARAATARAFGLGFVPSLQPIDVARNRVAIATLYALGAQPLIPWDVFVPDKPRYFGTVAEYGDLYAFVRKHANLFDAHEGVASVGIVADPRSFPRNAVAALVRRLGERQIPFEFVLVGPEAQGRLAPKLDRLRKLRLLITTLPESQVTPSDRKLMQNLGVPRLPVEAVPTAQLDALRPIVIAPGSEGLHTYVRSRPKSSVAASLVVHVVDERRGALGQPADGAACRRRIGLRPGALTQQLPDHATWVSPSGQTKLTAQRSGDGLYYTLPGCPLWGVLQMTGKG